MEDFCGVTGYWQKHNYFMVPRMNWDSDNNEAQSEECLSGLGFLLTCLFVRTTPCFSYFLHCYFILSSCISYLETVYMFLCSVRFLKQHLLEKSWFVSLFKKKNIMKKEDLWGPTVWIKCLSQLEGFYRESSFQPK